MDFLYWYLIAVITIIAICSAWSTAAHSEISATNEKLKLFGSMFLESAVSVIAYWCLVFVLALAIGTALWLILMLLIWVPSDFFLNYVGLETFSNALHSIKPYVYRSPSSPGFTSIPLLDYLSLYSAFVFSPWFGVWSILSKHQKRKNLVQSGTDPL